LTVDGHFNGNHLERTAVPLPVSLLESLSRSFYPERLVDHGQPRPRTAAVFFEPMSKRRKGFPSETQVKRGARFVHGTKELLEKVGRNDLCPCGSGKRFKKCCRDAGCFLRRGPAPLLLESDSECLPGPLVGQHSFR